MKTSIKLLLGTVGVFALASLRSKSDDDAAENEDEDEEEESQLAMTGFSSATSEAYELELSERLPVDLESYESDDPTCGQFYQSRRGDVWLGEHEQSITYRALYRTTLVVATIQGVEDPKGVAQRNASDPGMRKAFFDLCVGQAWGDETYGTYFLSTKDPVGPHCRGIPIVRFCADNRQRLLDGEAAMRVLPVGKPEHYGLGWPNRKTLHGTSLGRLRLKFPFLWLPVLNPDQLLRGIVTTRGMSWEDGSSALEPPPAIVRLRVVVLRA